MENSNKDLINYTSYVITSVSDVLQCSKILLYYNNNDEYKGFKITVNNIQQVYQEIITNNHSYLELNVEKDSNSRYFKYKLNDAKSAGLSTGFNIIMYLNSIDSPVGYTEFYESIGSMSNLNITISIKSSISGESSVNLNFLLDQVTDNLSTTKEFIGDNLYDFTSANKILNNLPKLNELFTSHLTTLLKNPNTSIYQQSQIILNLSDEINIYKLGLLKNRDIDPFKVGFNNFQVGRYGEDIVLYVWVKEADNLIKYCIYSLTKRNKFSNLKQYIKTKSNTGYLIIPDIIKEVTNEDGLVVNEEAAENIDILYTCGRFLICEGRFSDKSIVRKVLNTESDEPYWIKLNSDFVCFNEQTISSDLIHLDQSEINSSNSSIEEILEKLPNLYSTFLNTKELTTFSLKRKIGNWYLLYKNTSSYIMYYLVGKAMTIYLNEDDLDKLIIVNDNTVILNEDDYYVLYNKIGGKFYSERARATLLNCSLKTYNNILFAESDDNSNGDYSDSVYKDYYDKEIIKIIPKDSELKSSYLNNYRKNSYPINISGIPNIIGAVDGIIFYINNNKINYL